MDSRSDSAASVTHVMHLLTPELVELALKRMETQIRREGVDLSGIVLVHELLDRLDCEEHRPRTDEGRKCAGEKACDTPSRRE